MSAGRHATSVDGIVVDPTDPDQTDAARSDTTGVARLAVAGGHAVHLVPMAPSRDDTRILVFATLLVVAAGVLVAVVLLLATGRGGSPTRYEPFEAGAAREIERLLKEGGPYYVPDPFGGSRSILFALEDGEVVALSNVVPGTKDCIVNIRNEGKAFVDCNDDRLESTELARYGTATRTPENGNAVLYVDLRKRIPPPATAVASG